MTSIEQSLAAPVSSDLLSKANQQARTELSQWAERALKHYQDVEHELREIIGVVSGAAESLSDRDAKHRKEIGD